MSLQGGVGAVVCPRKALMAPAECCAKRNVEPHTLTTIEPALRFEGTSLRDLSQRKFVRSPTQFGGEPKFKFSFSKHRAGLSFGGQLFSFTRGLALGYRLCLRNVEVAPGDNLDEKEGNHRKHRRCRIVLFGKADKPPEAHGNDE